MIKIAFVTFKRAIDKDKEAYEGKCRKSKENADKH